VGETRGGHQICQAGRHDPMLAELAGGRRDDPLAGLGRLLSRLSHGKSGSENLWIAIDIQITHAYNLDVE
jgi:hypothetical protein